jgi:hypothetical protein
MRDPNRPKVEDYTRRVISCPAGKSQLVTDLSDLDPFLDPE